MNSSTSNSKSELDELLKIHKFSQSSPPIHVFLAKSTAPENVEDPNDDKIDDILKSRLENSNINDIAQILANTEIPEIVVRIHGYSTLEESAIKSYDSMIEDIKRFQNSDLNKTFVVLGYRWPSESPNIKNIFNALPILPRWILGVSFFGIIVSVALLLLKPLQQIPLMLFGFFSFLFSIIITLIVLRITAYFRDTFRATNYAVPDLVELIRNLETAILEAGIQCKKDKEYYKKALQNKIKLSFIAHSMGCYVTTNTMRILSNVFDPDAIKGNPKENIGNVFTLGRLILVAPDIPVETIMPRRANFLRSSLRRFQESYIFSNEGDVILRIASTAANYFSFPARDRFSGYRLGNLTVRHLQDNIIKYGIVNLDSLIKNENEDSDKDPINCLEVRSSGKEKKTLQDLLSETKHKEDPITNKFTYFDCTDYKDYNKNGKKVTPVSLAAKKKALDFYDYVKLFIDHLFRHKIDTHGGYFAGSFSKELIYKLAFFGFNGLIGYYPPEEQQQVIDQPEFIKQLNSFSDKCKEKQIQVVLSRERTPKFNRN